MDIWDNYEIYGCKRDGYTIEARKFEERQVALLATWR